MIKHTGIGLIGLAILLTNIANAAPNGTPTIPGGVTQFFIADFPPIPGNYAQFLRTNLRINLGQFCTPWRTLIQALCGYSNQSLLPIMGT